MTFWRSDAPELIGSCYRLKGNFVQLNAQPQLRATIKSCKSLEGELHKIGNSYYRKYSICKSGMLLVQEKLYVTIAK